MKFMDFGGNTTYGTAMAQALSLFNIINVFQSVLSYTLLQEDSARRTGRGLHKFHLGAAGKSHDVHVGPL